MTPEIALTRSTEHPWTRAPGWDVMSVKALDAACLEIFIRQAYGKFWMPFWQERGEAVLIKPSGAGETWFAPGREGTPVAHCKSLEVGELVYTDYSGQITRHKIVARELRNACQTGVLLKVMPRVPKSVLLNDAGNEFAGSPWIDAAWFRRAG